MHIESAKVPLTKQDKISFNKKTHTHTIDVDYYPIIRGLPILYCTIIIINTLIHSPYKQHLMPWNGSLAYAGGKARRHGL